MTIKQRNLALGSWATGLPGLPAIHVALSVLLILFSCAAFTVGAHAQTSYGSVVGMVTDPTGAALVGAKVTLVNTGTAAVQKMVSGAGGNYTFVNLNAGTYTVTVSAHGFKAETVSGVDVKVGEATRVDAHLTVGETSESVTVSAAESDLHTDSATLEGVIEERQVQDAPLNGRNVNNLLDFVPGVNPGGGTQGNTMANGGSGNFQAGSQTQAIAYGNYQIGGAFSGQSLFYVDGVESNISENNVNTLVPTQDAVQEFRVATNNISAEFSGYGGGVIQFTTKSGTNQFHGSAYEYARNTVFNANDWFSNNAGIPRQPFHQNQYGANLGGPALKNKLFFFFSWERESVIASSPASFVVPTTAELSGDFSKLSTQLTNPVTGAIIPGNKVTNIDSAALNILQLETPNESKVNQNNGDFNGLNNFTASAPIVGYQSQYNVRVDGQFAKDNLFVRYTYWNPHNASSDPMGNKTGSGPTGNTTQEAVLGDTHTLNPTTIADIRLSYIENYNFQVPLSIGYDMSQINSNYGTIESNSEGKVGFLPALGISGESIGAEMSQLYWNNNVWAMNGSVSKILGRHTLKTGASWRQVLWTAYGNSGGLTLNAIPSFGGNALASFLQGVPSSTGIGSQETTHAFLHSYSFFFTDTYQVTPKLTATAGINWEQPGAYSEEHNLDTVFNPTAAVTVGGLSSITNPVNNNNVPLIGAQYWVGSQQYPDRREENLHWKLFSPRVGLAYRLNANTVVRSGYGISFFPPEIDQDGPQLNSQTRTQTTVSNTAGQTPVATVANPLPNGFNLPSATQTQAALNSVWGGGLWVREPNVPYAYSQQWNLDVEHSFKSNMTASVAYAGSKGTHLIIATPYTGSGLQRNQLPDQYDLLGSALTSQVVNPFAGIFGGATVNEGQLLEPYPQYPSGVLQQAPRYGSSTYHALQATFVRHFSHGGILQGAYTWGKIISDTDNTSAFQDGQGGSAVVQDNYNLKAEKSISEQSVASNLVINYGVDLPIGKGQLLGANLGTAANEIVGGWRIGGITTIKTGLPIALTSPANTLANNFNAGTPPFNLGAGIMRPNYTLGCNKKMSGSAHSVARANEWFNTSCFTNPLAFGFGNESRVDSMIKTDGVDNWDISLDKAFPITETVRLNFTSQFFDLFNHPQFAIPNTTLGGSFGQITHQVNPPREVQLALRLSF